MLRRAVQREGGQLWEWGLAERQELNERPLKEERAAALRVRVQATKGYLVQRAAGTHLAQVVSEGIVIVHNHHRPFLLLGGGCGNDVHAAASLLPG